MGNGPSSHFPFPVMSNVLICLLPSQKTRPECLFCPRQDGVTGTGVHGWLRDLGDLQKLVLLAATAARKCIGGGLALLGTSASPRGPPLISRPPTSPYPYLLAGSNRSRSAGIRGNQRIPSSVEKAWTRPYQRGISILRVGHENQLHLTPSQRKPYPPSLPRQDQSYEHCRDFVHVACKASLLYIAAESGATLFREEGWWGDNFRNDVISGSSSRRETSLRSPHTRETERAVSSVVVSTWRIASCSYATAASRAIPADVCCPPTRSRYLSIECRAARGCVVR